MSGLLQGKAALVTGAARGIGQQIAEQLTREGARTAVLDVDADAANKAASAFGGYAVAADVTDAHSVAKAVDAVFSHFGSLDIFVNNAGMCVGGSLMSGTVDVWDKQFAVNARGAFLCCTTVARKMISGKIHGSIIVITSSSAITPRMDLGAYAASKAAEEMLTKCLALELAGHQIRVNALAPGSCETEMQRQQWAQLGVGPERQIRGDLSTFRTGIPLGRLAQPTDVANVAVLLASERTSFVTGQTWRVNGGQTL